jgi:hypothetical protein
MNGNDRTPSDPDALREDFVAELTCAAYRVALRHGTAGTWVDLELDLWRALTETVGKWGWQSPPRPDGAFVCDWAGGWSEAARRDCPTGKDL